MHIAIVEDESKVAQRIERLTREILQSEVSSIQRCASLDSALESTQSRPFDLVFLDLNLNGEDGFDLLAQSAASSFHTIIISANADQAIRAFEFGVLDFVPKPFTKQRLAQALDKLSAQRSDAAPTTTQKLAFRIHQKIVLKPLTEVIFIKGADAYSEVHFKDETTLLHDKSLSQLEHVLPKHFTRIHKSYIANLSLGNELIVEPNHKYSLCLSTGKTIPIGRTRYQELKSNWI